MKLNKSVLAVLAFVGFSGCASNSITLNPSFDFTKVKRIAVLDFEAAPENAGSGDVMGRIFEKRMLEAGYRLVDRQDVQKVIKEQNFQYSGAVTQEQAIKIGSILGVDAIVTGEATVYTPHESSIVMIDVESETREPIVKREKIELEQNGQKVTQYRDVIVDYRVIKEKSQQPQVYRVQAQAGLVVKMVDVQTGEIAWVGSASDEGINIHSAAEASCARIVRDLQKALLKSQKSAQANNSKN